MDSTEGSVFINVFHSEFDVEPWGTVYHSDSTGTRYSVTLPYNRRSGPTCDFHKIKGIDGVYIANIVTNKDDYDCKRCREFMRCNTLCTHATKITYDRGAQWVSLRAPKHDSKNNKVECSKDALVEGTDHCQLHLHGLATRSHMPVHSHDETVGIIIAAGNTGADLDGPMGLNTNVYLSRDAGMTWEEIAKGPHLYEMTDYGGLMVMVSANSQANQFSFSWDEGKSWAKTNLTKDGTPVSVRKIHHPHAPSVKNMIIEGEVSDDSIMYFVDLSQVHQRVCSGIDKPGDQGSDYEYFTPRNKCFLGRKVDYLRRKRDSTCFNPEGQRRKHKVENCKCTYADYECDFGYEPSKGENGEFICNPEKDFVPPTSPPRNCFTFYNVTRGYAKIAGDSCAGGLDLNPVRKACPKGLGLAGVVALLILSCALCVFVTYFVHKNSGPFRSALNRTADQYRQLDMNEEFSLDDDDDESASEIDESLFRGGVDNVNDRVHFNDENVRRKGHDEMRRTQDDVRMPSAPEVDESIFLEDDTALEAIEIEGEPPLMPQTPLSDNDRNIPRSFNPRQQQQQQQ